ncbi:hypothetical protein EV175_002266 [Coemansia sp. RSA 1933]|nr:hypothetical protein EV175_002266 [Coemansia sp. RSA 1933]
MTPYVVLVSYNDFNIDFCAFVEVPVNCTFKQFKWALCEKLREAKVAFITADELSFSTTAIRIQLVEDDDNFYNLTNIYNIVEIEAYYGTMHSATSSLSDCNLNGTRAKDIPVNNSITKRTDIPVLERENTLVESQPFSPYLSNKTASNELPPPPAYSSVDKSAAASAQFVSNFIYTC